MNKVVLEKLHYDKLKEKVKEYCVSGLGKELIDKLQPSNSYKNVNRMLDETSEGRNLIDASYHMPLEGIFNINPIIERLEKGAVLEAEDLLFVLDFLRGCIKVKKFIENKQGYAPTLYAYGKNLSELNFIVDEINICIKGNRVDSNASSELKKIRRHIDICEGNIKEKLERFLRNPSNKECIQEFFISQRNGRYTIPIKSSYKNKIPGNIIETSSKGNTVFMEPSSISKYTCKLEELKIEESIEEYKILSNISNMIFDNIRQIKINIEIIAEYDMILAKAKYSKSINGIKPKLNEKGYIRIINGVYPLIENAVPLNLEIGKQYRGIIITGPNAGGKTVVLKSIGLLTLAVQSGIHIQAEVNSEFSIFDNIFISIGDNQSVQNSLSTFSSHVKELSEIIKLSNKSTLLLFDEIGSGTEPNEGAALAIAILEELYHKGCIIVASTHYGEIKNFGLNHPDFETAAMEFEKDTLDPTYRLITGITGSSNALYIAKKMGISNTIIEKTKTYIKNKNYNYNFVKESKVRKDKKNEVESETNNKYNYNIGDKVSLLEENSSAIIYKGVDKYGNVTVLYNNQFIEVNEKRIKLEIEAKDLYPEGYDLGQLFSSFKDRKLEHDIERGSKKALKNIKKQFLK